MEKLRSFLRDLFSMETIKYMGAGAVAGGSNFCLYFILNSFFKVNYLISNFIAFVTGVIISYFLNKKYVFMSGTGNKKEDRKNFMKFFFSRSISCIADMYILYFLVDKIMMGSNIAKILDSCIISTANYLISKLIIFKKAI